MSVQNNVKLLRKSTGISQKAVAQYLNLSEMQYWRIENDQAKLDVDCLREIAKFLNINIDIFFDEELTKIVIKEREASYSTYS
ncbi:helix-turn-helix transcriptional regulator [Listeria booriae]|uniref:helix-turn-helix domain-containing protein n=1 Tax=Listeria booriae TaxID=1552123 RepID=UPI00162777D9|nr:helix-turn-helix transcriptional regulator [Listeria booriae]MBC1525472.1 helix-turn-helix transcriptional regulator [Listeria booriae]